MDHVRGAHDVPWEVKSISLEKFFPPWTVWRQVWSDSLVVNHSGISTDALLFSDVHLSLTNHYRVHKYGLPHMAFRKDYLARLRGSVSQAAGQFQSDPTSPVASSPVSSRRARAGERASGTSRLSRRGRRRMRPVRILEESVGDLQALTAHNPLDLQGAIVYDCRPPLLPISLQLKDIGLLPLHRTLPSASLAAPSQEDSMAIGGVSPNGWVVPELGVAPLADSDTALEDKLPEPGYSTILPDASLDGVRPPGGCSAPQDLVDLELEKALLCVSAIPAMLSPIEEPVISDSVAPSTYTEPPVPVLIYDGFGAPLHVSPLRVTADVPLLGVFPLYLPSPAYSVYEPVTSPVTTSSHEEDDYWPPPSPATMNQCLSRDGDLLLGDAVDLSREGPFDVFQDALESRATLQVLNSLPGCQYRMPSYDEDIDHTT